MNTADAARLVERLGERGDGVVALYLFGSHAEGRAHRESDLDIGVLLDWRHAPTAGVRFEWRLAVLGALSRPGEPVPDVVILNDAPPTLAARIVTTGARLLCRDSALEHAFRRNVQLRAADLQPFLRRTRAVKLQALER